MHSRAISQGHAHHAHHAFVCCHVQVEIMQQLGYSLDAVNLKVGVL